MPLTEFQTAVKHINSLRRPDNEIDKLAIEDIIRIEVEHRREIDRLTHIVLRPARSADVLTTEVFQECWSKITKGIIEPTGRISKELVGIVKQVGRDREAVIEDNIRLQEELHRAQAQVKALEIVLELQPDTSSSRDSSTDSEQPIQGRARRYGRRTRTQR